MANIIFSEGSNLNDSIYGKYQNPIKRFLEKRGEAFEQNSMLKVLFKMGTSNNFGDAYTSMTAMEGFEPTGEGGAYPTDGFQNGYDKLVVYETWKDSFRVTQEMVEDSKMLDLKKQPAAFMTGYERTREQFGAALYGAAIGGNTSFNFKGRTFDAACMDGGALFGTTHANKITATQQSNKFSNAFSADALGLAETAMQNFTGDNDELLDVSPDTILIPNNAALKKAVFAAIGADKEPTTANNAFSYQYGRWNVIIWPYLNRYCTGIAPWILLDSSYIQDNDGPVWTDRVKLSVKSTIDDNTDDNIWRGRSRFNAAFVDWRFASIGGIEGGTELS